MASANKLAGEAGEAVAGISEAGKMKKVKGEGE